MISLIAGLALSLTQADPTSARDLVDRAMLILGGRQKLESIRQVIVTTVGHNYLVEQSERPMGPYVTTYNRGTRTYDFDKLAESADQTFAGLVYGGREMPRRYEIVKGEGRASVPFENYLSLRRMVLGPERILLYALDAPDLRIGRETVFNGIPHRTLEFKWGTMPVRLFLKKETGTASGVETTSQLAFPWTTLGDVPMTTRWGNWQVLDNGVMEPSQLTTEAGGYPVSDETVLTCKAILGPGKPNLAAPNTLAKEDPQAMLARYRQVKLAEGITEYVGPFNTFVVEQPDGLVVIEPVLTSAFASAFLNRLSHEHPRKKITTVIATDDAWPHFGGVRTFVARGIELVVLDHNLPIVQRFCDAIHISVPDELSAKRMKPRFRLVRRPTKVGTGVNRIVLYPISGQGSERMVMAYFPGRKLLYGSDLLQKQGDGFFFAAYPKELAEAVTRERLDVETVFAEHLTATPWKSVTDFVKNHSGN